MELGGLDVRDDEGRPDASSITDRATFAEQLTRARDRAGKSIRALARELNQPAATLGGYFSGQHLPGVAQTALFRDLLRQLGITDAGDVERWLDALARVRRKPGPRPAGQTAPYRGLEPFRTEDADWFFGREVLADAIVRRAADLVKDPVAGAILAVVGPSGSGKSSVLRAGVVPAVLEGRSGFGSGWRCSVICPGSEPISRLAAGLAEVGDEPAEQVEDRLRGDPTAWPAMAEAPGGVVIVVDQFEEVFTSCDDLERSSFLSILAGAAEVRHGDRGRAVVVLGMRADFYGVAAGEPLLVPVLQDRQLVVGPLSLDELRRAICEPARRAGFDVDNELVDLLMREVAPRRSVLGPSGTSHEPGALPLLSHALLETWQRARRKRLTTADYQATGGIAGAVQQTAERLYEELDDEERGLTRQLLLRLVNVDDEFVVTRRRLPWADLPAPGAGVGAVVDRFVAHRLLTVEADSVEVSHEALLTAWPRLREWVDADRAGLRVHRQLGEAARLWVEHDRDTASLLRGARLDAAQAWASSVDHRDDLNAVEAAFLDASTDHARREEATSRRRTRRLKALLAFVAALAVAAASLAGVAERARGAADRTRDLALSRQLAIQATRLRATDPALATQLALTAYRIAPTVDARSALLDSAALPTATRLVGQPGATAVGVSGDGRSFAVSRAIDGTVQLFSLDAEGAPARRGVVPAAAPDTRPFAVAFSPRSEVLAVGGTDNAVRLWDVSDEDHPRAVGPPLGGFTGAVQTLAFSPDGRTLAAGGTAPGVLRWDVSDPNRIIALAPLAGVTGTTQTVTFAPDGRTIAAGGTDGVMRLWADGSPDTPVAELPAGNGTTFNSAAFSPTGGLLAAGSKDKTVRIWDVNPGRPPVPAGEPLTGFGSWVNTVAFSADGATLAAGGSDNSIRFWTVDGWHSVGPALTSPAPVTGVRFLPGSNRVLTVGEDGAARLWTWPGPHLSGARDTVFGLSYSGDGRRLAVFPNRGDDRIRIWDVVDRRHPVLLGAVPMPPELGVLDATGALSRDGRTLAAGTRAGPVQLFDVSDPAHAVVGPTLTGLTDLVEQVAFSPDDNLVLAASDDGSVCIWDRARPGAGAISTIPAAKSLILGMAVSPDGRLLATADAEKLVRLWDISTPARPAPMATLEGFDNYAYSVAFSPDGTVLAAGSADKTLRLWSLADPQHPRQLGEPLTGPGNYVYSVGFDPSGDVLSAAVTDGAVWRWDVTDPSRPVVLATLTAASTSQVFVVAPSPTGSVLAAGDNNAVHLFDTDPDAVARDACATVGDAITPKEWAQYLPGERYRPPCRSPVTHPPPSTPRIVSRSMRLACPGSSLVAEPEHVQTPDPNRRHGSTTSSRCSMSSAISRGRRSGRPGEVPRGRRGRRRPSPS